MGKKVFNKMGFKIGNNTIETLKILDQLREKRRKEKSKGIRRGRDDLGID